MDLRLEPQADHHAEALFAALNDHAIYRFIGGEPPESVDAVRRRIARQANGPTDGSGDIWLNWIVRVDGDVAGFTQATISPDGTANLAFVIAPNFWGRSIAHAACQKTIEHLTARGDVTRLVADTDRANTKSRALLERLGFRFERKDGPDVFYELVLGTDHSGIVD